jgi:hypothetical protein
LYAPQDDSLTLIGLYAVRSTGVKADIDPVVADVDVERTELHMCNAAE